jgi:hypothetical protein
MALARLNLGLHKGAVPVSPALGTAAKAWFDCRATHSNPLTQKNPVTKPTGCVLTGKGFPHASAPPAPSPRLPRWLHV